MALSATSVPMPVTSPSVMPIQPVIKVESCWLGVGRKNVPNSRWNSEQADECLFFQLFNPLLYELFLLLRAEGRFDVVAHFAERFDVRGTRLLDEHEVTGFGCFNHAADLAGFERE